MDVRKTIAELTSQLSETNYDSEEDNVLLKGTNYDDANSLSVEDYNDDIVIPSLLRKTTDNLRLPENVYGGKTTSRKKTHSIADSSEEELFNTNNFDQSDEEKFSESEEESASETEESQTVSPQVPHKKEDSLKEPKDYTIYSAESKNVTSDIKKGFAIKNQLRIWENLLEGRIKLQQALVASNNLPSRKSSMKTKSQLDAENQQKMNKCKRSLLCLLGKLVDLQKELMKQCPEFENSKENFNEINEEIPSDESEIEDENEQEKDEDEPLRKKRKLNEYSSSIQNDHVKFIPLRNACIQKWNDKTKVSSGKMANSNFSAFDQSTLKQIEQIMADKSRLLNRTRIRRIDGQPGNKKDQDEPFQESQEVNLDPEVFDDTDFYHKLLRDYIDRKSVDVASSSHTERQLIELHKLRSKMKKNVDTKSTKGRKIRYVVLPKLVNYMAPNPYNTWSGEAETELYNSLFGKIKV